MFFLKFVTKIKIATSKFDTSCANKVVSSNFKSWVRYTCGFLVNAQPRTHTSFFFKAPLCKNLFPVDL